jgi:putative copper resistance protein D
MEDLDQANGDPHLLIFQALVVTRWLHFAAIFAMFGSALFWFYVDGEFGAARRATRNWLRGAALLAAASGVGWLAAIIANMAGGWDGLADPEALRLFFIDTPFGPVARLRLVLLAAAFVVAIWPRRGRRWLGAQMAIGAALLIGQAWLGHAADGVGLRVAAMISAYCVHVLAAAAWIGGLAPLLFVLREQGRSGAAAGSPATLAVLSRYSAIAMIAVALVVASGLLNLGFRTGFAPQRAVWGAYGLVLGVKAAAVAAMLALACFNRFFVMPQLPVGDPALAARLRASVAGEILLGALVLGAAATLGVTPPPT